MEIGITWEDKLVYNKEIKINKKAVKTGLIITGIGIACVALSIALTPPVATYALSLDSAEVISEATGNSKLIFDTLKNSAQFKDFQDLFQCTFNNMSDANKILVNDGIKAFMASWEEVAGDTLSKMDPETIKTLISERSITYIQSEKELFDVLKQCMFK